MARVSKMIRPNKKHGELQWQKYFTGEHTMLLLFDTKIDCSIIMSKVDEKWTIYINQNAKITVTKTA